MKRLLLSVAALAVCASLAIAANAPKKTTAAPAQIKDSAMQQIEQFIATSKIDKTKPGWKTSLPKPPVASFEKEHTYFARMVTNKGPMLIEFMPKVAPMHVSSFIYLAKLGFYDGLKFHRVIKGFMAQGGDPLGTGGGNPGYRMNGEFSPEEKHDRDRRPGNGRQPVLPHVRPGSLSRRQLYDLRSDHRRPGYAQEARGRRRER